MSAEQGCEDAAGTDDAVAAELADYLDEVDRAVSALCTPQYVAGKLAQVLARSPAEEAGLCRSAPTRSGRRICTRAAPGDQGGWGWRSPAVCQPFVS